ncbi:MAG: polysaccharide biosynthesis tyrosine autokinase [Bacteroidia bacterium]|nr:polysaccharide biosynthesis tyrosine autokinase [Bacteroidia bacterium]
MKRNEQNIDTTPDKISLKAFLYKSIKYWYLFVLALVISSALAFYKVRYNVPGYNVSARILIKDEGSQYGAGADFIPGMQLLRSRSWMVNEIGIIRSFPLMRKVMDDLPDFRVTYSDIGNIKTMEFYKDSPFSVEWDTAQKSVYNKTFYIKMLSPEKFLLSEVKIEENEGTEHSFNVPFNAGGGTIVVRLTKAFSNELLKKLFSFKINNMDDQAVAQLGTVVLNVEMKESSILQLSSSGKNAQKTIDFVNSLIRAYINYGIEQANLTVTNTLTFVDQQLHNISDSLGVSESDMLAFNVDVNNRRIAIGGGAMRNEGGEAFNSNGGLIAQIIQYERQKIALQFSINYYKYTLDYIAHNDDSKGLIIPMVLDASGGTASSTAVSANISRLMDLYLKRSNYAFSTTDKSGTFQQVQIEISAAKQILTENLKSELEKLKFDMDQLNSQLSTAENKLAQIPPAEREYTTLKRKYSLSNNLYTFLLQKRSEASIAKAASISKVQVLDWATKYRVSYIGITPASVYTSYIFLGLALAVGIVLLLLLFNTRIIDKNDIESITKIPIAGVIGHSNKQINNVVIDSPKSVISEAFRAVRTNISYMTAGKEKIVVVITSSVSGEGKTFCAINLASIYALSGKKTLLLGADLRQPKIYMDFGLSNSIGMSSYLIRKANFDEVVQLTNLENLDIILSGPIPPNPAELLGSPATEEMINIAKERYDVVIIDTAPFGLVTDSLLLTSYADANIYVVRQFYTRRKQLHAINQHFIDGKTKNLGIIVNDLKQERLGYGRYGYGYGYGYGGTYGYGYGYYSDDMNKSKKKFSWKSLFGA